MYKYKFEDYKNHISIIDVATDIGYTIEVRCGLRTPQYRLYRGEQKIDEIVIRNPKYSAIQTYISRRGDGGGLIQFVLNRLDMFTYPSHLRDYAAVNEILSRYMSGTPVVGNRNSMDNQVVFKDYVPFNLSDYELIPGSIENLSFLTKKRKISSETLSLFLPFIYLAKYKNHSYYNVAFPFVIPGQSEFVNLELRNYNYKGFPAGGNKREAVFIACWQEDPAKVTKVFFFESSIDLMSFIQLFQKKLDLEAAAFVACGGYVSQMQIVGSMNLYSNGVPYFCFDNDDPGNVYDVIAAASLLKQDWKAYHLKPNVTIEINKVKTVYAQGEFSSKSFFKEHKVPYYIVKPQLPYKDWNDVLCN